MAQTRATTGMTERIAAMQDFKLYRELSWEGSFEDYLQIVRERPQVTRNAYQRAYDMVISYGTEEYIDNKKRLIRYNFFKDELSGGQNAIYGLDIPLMRFVHVLKAAAEGYGPESASSCSTGRSARRRARLRGSSSRASRRTRRPRTAPSTPSPG